MQLPGGESISCGLPVQHGLCTITQTFNSTEMLCRTHVIAAAKQK
jgi:hypothetical protein